MWGLPAPATWRETSPAHVRVSRDDTEQAGAFQECMLGILLALSSAVSWGSGDFLSGLLGRRLPLPTVLLVSQAAGVPLMLALALWRGVPSDWAFLPYGVLASFTGLWGLAALFRGMAVGLISIVAPISATGAVIPVVVGLLTGERPTPLQGAGVALALLGVAVASRPSAPQDGVGATGHAARLAAGASFGLLAAAGFGLYYVVLRYASDAAGQDPYWPVLVQRAVSTVLLLVVAAALRPRLVMSPTSAGTLALAGTLDVSANALYAAASTSGIGPLAAVLSSLFPISTIALARMFLQERLSGAQAFGVVSALAGVVLIAWR